MKNLLLIFIFLLETLVPLQASEISRLRECLAPSSMFVGSSYFDHLTVDEQNTQWGGNGYKIAPVNPFSVDLSYFFEQEKNGEYIWKADDDGKEVTFRVIIKGNKAEISVYDNESIASYTFKSTDMSGDDFSLAAKRFDIATDKNSRSLASKYLHPYLNHITSSDYTKDSFHRFNVGETRSGFKSAFRFLRDSKLAKVVIIAGFIIVMSSNFFQAFGNTNKASEGLAGVIDGIESVMSENQDDANDLDYNPDLGGFNGDDLEQQINEYIKECQQLVLNEFGDGVFSADELEKIAEDIAESIRKRIKFDGLFNNFKASSIEESKDYNSFMKILNNIQSKYLQNKDDIKVNADGSVSISDDNVRSGLLTSFFGEVEINNFDDQISGFNTDIVNTTGNEYNSNRTARVNLFNQLNDDNQEKLIKALGKHCDLYKGMPFDTKSLIYKMIDVQKQKGTVEVKLIENSTIVQLDIKFNLEQDISKLSPENQQVYQEAVANDLNNKAEVLKMILENQDSKEISYDAENNSLKFSETTYTTSEVDSDRHYAPNFTHDPVNDQGVKETVINALNGRNGVISITGGADNNQGALAHRNVEQFIIDNAADIFGNGMDVEQKSDFDQLVSELLTRNYINADIADKLVNQSDFTDTFVRSAAIMLLKGANIDISDNATTQEIQTAMDNANISTPRGNCSITGLRQLNLQNLLSDIPGLIFQNTYPANGVENIADAVKAVNLQGDYNSLTADEQNTVDAELRNARLKLTVEDPQTKNTFADIPGVLLEHFRPKVETLGENPVFIFDVSGSMFKDGDYRTNIIKHFMDSYKMKTINTEDMWVFSAKFGHVADFGAGEEIDLTKPGAMDKVGKIIEKAAKLNGITSSGENHANAIQEIIPELQAQFGDAEVNVHLTTNGALKMGDRCEYEKLLKSLVENDNIQNNMHVLNEERIESIDFNKLFNVAVKYDLLNQNRDLKAALAEYNEADSPKIKVKLAKKIQDLVDQGLEKMSKDSNSGATLSTSNIEKMIKESNDLYESLEEVIFSPERVGSSS